MKGQVGMLRAVGRIVTPFLIVTLLAGTAWTGRASVARIDVDPALHSGDLALIQVARETAWTVAHELTTAGVTDVTVFDSVGVVSARVNDRALATIATDRSVLRATSDGRVAAVGGGKGPKDLDRVGSVSTKDSIGIAAIDATAAWNLTRGAGVTVALMDTGIGAHPDLPSGKVVARIDLANDGAPGLDPAGHGTHLAGIIAANGATFRGVAPDARLVDIRVLDASGEGSLHDVVAGFEWLLDHRVALGIRVLNLSFGTTQTSSYHADLLAALAESAWFSGITVVAAAGNDGDDAGTISTPGADPFVITAGSFDDQGTPSEQDDRLSAFSSRGPTLDGFTKPDVLAPGRRVVSLRSTQSPMTAVTPHPVGGPNKPTNNNLYTRMSGTSVSSAMVSGVAALVLSFHTSYTPTKTKGAILAFGRGITGSPTKAVTAVSAVLAPPRTVNAGLLPSRLLMAALEASGVIGNGTTWEGVTWEGVTWEGVMWESVTWEAVTWESVSWEGVAWEQASVTTHSAEGASR
jgi:serine protease AprX